MNIHKTMDKREVKIRLLDRVVIDDNGCWIWQLSKRTGYGVIKVNGQFWGTHRLAYYLWKGDPGDLFVCHSCDVRACVNPEHLWLGSHADNIKDAYEKGRIEVPDGSENWFEDGRKPPNRLLSDRQAKVVKKAIENRDGPLREVAERFDLPMYLIKDISCGRNYVNV